MRRGSREVARCWTVSQENISGRNAPDLSSHILVLPCLCGIRRSFGQCQSKDMEEADSDDVFTFTCSCTTTPSRELHDRE